MKTYLIAIAMMIACQGTFAQSTQHLFEQFKDKESAEYVNVSPLMMKLSRLFMDTDDKSYKLIKGVKSVKVLDLEDCSTEVKELFRKEANKLNLSGYETLVQTKEDDESVQLIAKMDEENINELVVVITGNDECALTLMKGKIKKEDIEVLMTDDKIMIDGRE